MQTPLQHLFLVFLFLLILANVSGCKTIQVQCDTPTCADLSSRLHGHAHTINKLRTTKNGKQRAFTYALTELKGQGWEILKTSAGSISLKLAPESETKGSVHIHIRLHDGMQEESSDYERIEFDYLPVVLEIMQVMASMKEPLKAVYVSLGGPDPTQKNRSFDTQIEFDPFSGRGCIPNISTNSTNNADVPIQISCLSPAQASPTPLYDAWASYIRAARDDMRPFLVNSALNP